MTTAFRRSFTRDLRKIKDRHLLAKVQRTIENVEAANEPSEITNLKKLGKARMSIASVSAIIASASS